MPLALALDLDVGLHVLPKAVHHAVADDIRELMDRKVACDDCREPFVVAVGQNSMEHRLNVGPASADTQVINDQK